MKRMLNHNKSGFGRAVLIVILAVGLVVPDVVHRSAFNTSAFVIEQGVSHINPVASAPSSLLFTSGLTLTVTNTSLDLNGDTWSPVALVINPGPDGISLAEALKAVEADTAAHETIQFDPSLNGATILVDQPLTAIWRDGLTLDGDIDDDGVPDIILEGAGIYSHGLTLQGASRVIIEGLELRNFTGAGLMIGNNPPQGISDFGNLVIRNNTITNMLEDGILLSIQGTDHATIHDVEIVGNVLQNNRTGIKISPGLSTGASDNHISNVAVISNTITNSGYNIGIFVSSASIAGNSRNTINDIEIRGNQLNGHTNTSILVDAANQADCHNNTIQGLVIAGNQVDGTPVTIELISVGESGANATGNLLSEVAITDNVLTGGGIQFGGATGSNASGNTISNVQVDRNHITACAANGIYLVSGSGGAHDNLFENVFLGNNFVKDCHDAGVLLHGESWTSPNNILRDVHMANLTLVANGVGSSWAGGINVNSKYYSNLIQVITVTNTILWGNGGGDAIRGSITPDRVAYSLLNDLRFTGSDGNFYQDPGFADPASQDYRLGPGSACLDSGDPAAVGTGPQDLDLRARVWDGDGDLLPVVDRGAWEYGSPLTQEIVLRGNGYEIRAGDSLPAPWDGTHFGAAAVGGGGTTQVFTIQNTGDLPLVLDGIPVVSIAGMHPSNFSVSMQAQTPIAPGSSTSFTLVFTPSALGLRQATVVIPNDDSDENPYTFAIEGWGQSCQYLPLVIH